MPEDLPAAKRLQKTKACGRRSQSWFPGLQKPAFYSNRTRNVLHVSVDTKLGCFWVLCFVRYRVLVSLRPPQTPAFGKRKGMFPKKDKKKVFCWAGCLLTNSHFKCLKIEKYYHDLSCTSGKIEIYKGWIDSGEILTFCGE